MERQPVRRDLRDGQLVLVVLVAGMLLQLPGLFWDVPGGKAINNALRILDGDVPYRDFWTMYAPGHFYVGALLFKLFGIHVWVNGAAAHGFTALGAALIALIARRIGVTTAGSLLAGAGFVAVMWRPASELDSYRTALPFLLLAVDRVIRYVQRRRPVDLVLAGGWCGVGAWFKHDVAFHVTMGMVAGLVTAWALLPADRRSGWVRPPGILVRVAAGSLLTALPMIAYLAWAAWPEVWQDLVVFPATDFRVVRGEPYPPLMPRWRWVALWLDAPADPVRIARAVQAFSRWIEANVPQIVFLVGLALVVRARRTISPDRLSLALVGLATMPFFWASAHVQQNTHFHSLWLLSLLLGALVWTQAPRHSVLRWLTTALLIAQTAALLTATARAVAQIAYYWPNHGRLEVPVASGLRLPRPWYEVYQPIASFVRAHVPEDEPIYVGLIRHDAVVISNQAFYYLTGRDVASRYNELHPGITDRAEVQREIIADLERRRVRCAVLWNFGWPAATLDGIVAERRRHLPELGATLLDEYFRERFQEVARHGEYVLVWRRDSALTSAGSPRGSR
jgi:hypothetical protein